MKKLSLILLALGLALPVFAQTKTLLNLDKSGVAIQGYDPVAFFTDGKPVKGDAKFVSKRDGAIYLFASKEHKDLFNADPAKYEHVFGGYCDQRLAKFSLHRRARNHVCGGPCGAPLRAHRGHGWNHGYADARWFRRCAVHPQTSAGDRKSA